MKKTLIAIVAVCLALALGVGVVVMTVLILPEQYDRLYLGELADKYARLRSLDNENKIIIIGGSSVAFGISSPMIEENLGMPAVNFGLYGPLGVAIMMDLTRGHIREGDIVVLAPETDHQTMSMYLNGEAMWGCCDSDFTMLFRIRAENWGEMLGSFWTYALKKYQFYLYGKPQPDGVYDHDSFDEYGDIAYIRTGPTLEEGYDTEVPLDLSADIVDQDYIDYVNEYIEYCRGRGAQVYFSWPPMNRLAIVQDERGVLEYATFIRETFHCPLISNILEYIMGPESFYDTNYHLTDAGVVEHTARLIQDLWNVIGDGSKVDIVVPASVQAKVDAALTESTAPDAAGIPSGDIPADEPLPAEAAEPAPTPVPTPEAVGSSRDAQFFTYEPFSDGIMVTGVTGEGARQSELEIPWLIDGQKVVAIGQEAFAECENLRALYIQSNVSRVMQGAFDGAPRLTEIHIDNEAGANILVPGTGLFDNVSGRLRVYVPQDAYGTFLADYFWGNYIDRLVAE